MEKDTEVCWNIPTTTHTTVCGTYKQGEDKHTDWDAHPWNKKQRRDFCVWGDTPDLTWKDGLTKNIVELPDFIKLEETSVKTKCKMNSNDQNMQLTADQRHQDKTLAKLH